MTVVGFEACLTIGATFQVKWHYDTSHIQWSWNVHCSIIIRNDVSFGWNRVTGNVNKLFLNISSIHTPGIITPLDFTAESNGKNVDNRSTFCEVMNKSTITKTVCGFLFSLSVNWWSRNTLLLFPVHRLSTYFTVTTTTTRTTTTTTRTTEVTSTYIRGMHAWYIITAENRSYILLYVIIPAYDPDMSVRRLTCVNTLPCNVPRDRNVTK